MKVYLTQFNRKNVIGGGWNFNKNLQQGLKDKVNFVSDLNDADIFLISGLTQTERGEIDLAEKKGIPIIFRVDNIPKPSRNKRIDVKKRLKDYSSKASFVVYQSNWVKNQVKDYCGDGVVIYNGVDKGLFNPDGDTLPKTNKVYLCIQHSSNINKRFEEVKHIFEKKKEDKELWLVGRFEGKEYNYDFINDEKVREFGVIEDRKTLAKIYRSADVLIYPSFADACPNVVLEAMASGLKIEGINKEGGTIELFDLEDISLERMAQEYLSLFRLCL